MLLNSTYSKDFGKHLLQRSKEIAAFATPGGVFQYKIKPFGMKNLIVTFQRLINIVIAGLHASKAYIDDAILSMMNGKNIYN